MQTFAMDGADIREKMEQMRKEKEAEEAASAGAAPVAAPPVEKPKAQVSMGSTAQSSEKSIVFYAGLVLAAAILVGGLVVFFLR